MVDPYGPPAQGLVDSVEGATDDRRAQMANPEGLGDVGRGVVDHDRLSCALVAAPVVRALAEHRRQNVSRPADRIDAEVDEGSHGFDRGEARRQSLGFDGRRKLLRDSRSGLAHLLAQPKAGDREVAHVRIRRDLDQLGNLSLIEWQAPGDRRLQHLSVVDHLRHALPMYAVQKGLEVPFLDELGSAALHQALHPSHRGLHVLAAPALQVLHLAAHLVS